VGSRELLEGFKGFAKHCGVFLSMVALPVFPERLRIPQKPGCRSSSNLHSMMQSVSLSSSP